MSYKTLIGLELHVQLMTNTKIFCSCSAAFGGEENTRCCPVCLGLPGSLPVINKRVIEYAIRAGLALKCSIAEKSKMDRKNYFYPDLPKAYQISQYDLPLCKDGYLEIETEEDIRKIRIRRIHIEEDAGKSLHLEDGASLLDYNRSGIPLIEIVTEPDLTSSRKAYAFLTKLKAVIESIEISDCRMEQGSLRCDININVINEEGTYKSNIVELKNLNSFKAAVKAIDYEEKRHIDLLTKGENTKKETRRWDDIRNKTVVMRSKEHVEDYRYFPDPDLVEIMIDKNWVKEIESSLPELPDEKLKRFMRQYNLSEYDGKVIISSKKLSCLFEDTNKIVKDSKIVSNWLMTEVLRRANEENVEIDDIKIDYNNLASLLLFIKDGTISVNIAKKVFKEMMMTGQTPGEIIKEQELKQITDEEVILRIIKLVLDSNPKSIEDFKSGKDKAIGFLIGQVMKKSNGKANPQKVDKLIRKLIN